MVDDSIISLAMPAQIKSKWAEVNTDDVQVYNVIARGIMIISGNNETENGKLPQIIIFIVNIKKKKK